MKTQHKFSILLLHIGDQSNQSLSHTVYWKLIMLQAQMRTTIWHDGNSESCTLTSQEKMTRGILVFTIAFT